jgi:putative radical SAM enzyme (TIGR03279 family)
MPAKIIEIVQNSIAEDLGIGIGDEILKINGKIPKDYIDYNFLTTCEELVLWIKHADGTPEIYEIEKDFDEDLGIVFDSAVFDKIKPCTNHCIFCFVDGQPEGLRKTLYIKDDDYRLSYLQGSYVTLTNLTEKDKQRIASMHLGPLYVSVHSMNEELRAQMLRNPKAKLIKENLNFLKENDIPFHAQIVLCPNINDGKELQYSLEELHKYKSILLSVAIVPVGITQYRNDCLKTVDKEIALKCIEIVDNFNKTKRKKYPVCLSDEFFLLAEKEIPNSKYYGNFEQIEDGVGSLRLIKDDFKKTLKRLPKKIKNPLRLTFGTSKSAYGTFLEFAEHLNKIENLTVEIIEVEPKFWGEKISVAGLICYQDLVTAVSPYEPTNLIIPSVMLSPYTNKFLDGKTVEDLRNTLNCNIHVIQDIYSTRELLDIIK